MEIHESLKKYRSEMTIVPESDGAPEDNYLVYNNIKLLVRSSREFKFCQFNESVELRSQDLIKFTNCVFIKGFKLPNDVELHLEFNECFILDNPEFHMGARLLSSKRNQSEVSFEKCGFKESAVLKPILLKSLKINDCEIETIRNIDNVESIEISGSNTKIKEIGSSLGHLKKLLCTLKLLNWEFRFS